MAAIKGSVDERHHARASRDLEDNIGRQLGRLSEPDRGRSKGKAPVVVGLGGYSSARPDTEEENRRKSL